MIDSINKLPYKDKQWGTFLVKNIISSKKKLGLGNDFTMEDLSQELNKPVINKFPRKKIIVNYIDEIHSCDLVDMVKYSRMNKGFKYIFTNIDVFSKYAWSFLIKSKKISDIKPCFQKIFKEKKPKFIWSDKEKNHFVDFQIPIFLKDISSFFKNVDIIHYGEFNIILNLIDELVVSSREGVTYDIKSAYLIVEEIKLDEEDEIRYLKKLDNGYIKTINFLENHVTIFNDKFNINRRDFYLNNVRNGDSVYIYGILDANKTGLNYDMPSVKFNEPYLLIDNVRFENSIPNDISAYRALKSKSMYSNNFIINYDDYINYYRIYFLIFLDKLKMIM